jgi:hypothetical protein
MTARQTYLALMFCIFGFEPTNIEAVVIDFEALRHDDAVVSQISNPYSENGFILTPHHPVQGNPEIFATLGTLHPGFAGSTALYQGVSQGQIVLTRTDGGVFTLLSIELAEEPNLAPGGTEPINLGPFEITFYGERVNGNTITNTFTVDSFLTLKEFLFVGFGGLVSVYWYQGAGGISSPTHQFDDIRVVPVPELASFLHFITGLILIYVRRRRVSARQ